MADIAGGYRLIHTGVFATPDEVAAISGPVPMAEYAAASLTGNHAMPAAKVSRLCRSYGLPDRSEPGSRFAIDVETCELLYAVPANQPEEGSP